MLDLQSEMFVFCGFDLLHEHSLFCTFVLYKELETRLPSSLFRCQQVNFFIFLFGLLKVRSIILKSFTETSARGLLLRIAFLLNILSHNVCSNSG